MINVPLTDLALEAARAMKGRWFVGLIAAQASGFDFYDAIDVEIAQVLLPFLRRASLVIPANSLQAGDTIRIRGVIEVDNPK